MHSPVNYCHDVVRCIGCGRLFSEANGEFDSMTNEFVCYDCLDNIDEDSEE